VHKMVAQWPKKIFKWLGHVLEHGFKFSHISS
jgi:hypothetical protein